MLLKNVPLSLSCERRSPPPVDGGMPSLVKPRSARSTVNSKSSEAPGSQRLRQPVDPIARLLIVDDELQRCRRGHAQPRTRIHRDVQLADRRVVLVDEPIVAADLHAALAGIDVDVGAHVDDARLRQILVLAVLLLVVRLAVEHDVRRQILVEHVRVVEDPAADRDERQHRRAPASARPAARAASAAHAASDRASLGAAPRTQNAAAITSSSAANTSQYASEPEPSLAAGGRSRSCPNTVSVGVPRVDVEVVLEAHRLHHDAAAANTNMSSSIARGTSDCSSPAGTPRAPPSARTAAPRATRRASTRRARDSYSRVDS